MKFYRKRNKKALCAALAAVFIVTFFPGCYNSSAEKESPRFNPDAPFRYSSFRDIPGVTEEEISAVDAFRAIKGSFVYGMNPSAEAFVREDGEIRGYAALFCGWLSELLDIPFEPKICAWNDLVAGLRTGEIDFTGALAATAQRRRNFYMTDPIAERPVKTIRLAGSPSLSDIAAMRRLRYAFLNTTTTAAEISVLSHIAFDSVFIDSYETAYRLLLSGGIDAFVDEGAAEAAFNVFGDVIAEDFYPLVYSPVSMSTQNPALETVISVVDKALRNGGIYYLAGLYSRGNDEYRNYKLRTQLTEEELEYLRNTAVVPFAAEHDNYPLSFYNHREKEWQGIVFDVLGELEELTGLSFQHVNGEQANWSVLLKQLDDGEAAFITELIRTEGREGNYLWPETPVVSDRYALVSKSEYRNIGINEILFVRVGLYRNTAYAELFRKWFPSHMNTVEYDTLDLAFNALARGEIDMVMASLKQLLYMTHYRELPGYKANIIFDRSFESTFGFNKKEKILCSIIDKTLQLVNVGNISDRWMRQTFDYRAKISQSRLPWLIGATILLLCVLILLYILFQRKRHEGKHLEDQVEARTSELNKQHTLMRMINEATVLLLETDTEEPLGATIHVMEIIGRCVDVDRISVWQNHRLDDGRLYYKAVCQWAEKGLPELDMDTYFSYDDIVPSWEIYFNRGESVNGPVDGLSDAERSVLTEFRLKSILAIPIFIEGGLWGFISLDDYRNLRVFSESELNVLRSWGLLIVAAIQRARIAQGMRDTLAKMEAVLKSYKGVIWSVDCGGVITTFNGQYLRTIGIEPSSLEGKKLEVARLENRRLDIIDNVEKTFREGPQDWTVEIDGSVFHSCTAPMYDADGNLVGVVGSTDDVTETFKLHRDLKTAVEAAQAASRAKSDFLANMSHEIRTPMNAIIGMIAIGKSAPDNERKDYCFMKIEDASKHLLGIINDILDMSKIEASKFELSPAEFGFEKMLQQVVNVINFRVDQKHQKLMVHIDERIPRNLVGDDQRIAQVITNLLSNAVKFTPDNGSITVDTELLNEDAEGCMIKITVTDSGIGISADQQARLFQSFAQAESNTTRKFGGTGLGLAISRSIVEMMGGRIWIESELGKGSTFAFTMRVKPGGSKKHRLLTSNVNLRNVRILAVDDDPDILEYFRNIMQRFETPCDIAKSAGEALELIRQKGSYNIYFVDWKMPDIDGIELTKALKERTSAPGEAVVVMISAAEWNAIEEEARKAGVDKFLSKPLFPSMIADIVSECLGVDTQEVEKKAPDTAGLFAGHRILLVEDVEINREIVLALLESTLLNIDCAVNGVEAVRMFSEDPGKYEMIFMDIQMPEMDGYEATRRIRALDLPKAKTIPIIAMTANVFREDIEKSMEAGMSSHIGKPLDFDDVLDKLRHYLPKNRRS